MKKEKGKRKNGRPADASRFSCFLRSTSLFSFSRTALLLRRVLLPGGEVFFDRLLRGLADAFLFDFVGGFLFRGLGDFGGAQVALALDALGLDKCAGEDLAAFLVL